MGQKVNPLVFRINSKDTVWNSQYFPVTNNESSHLLYQDLMVREALDKIFINRGAILDSCIIRRSATELKIFMQFYATKTVGNRSILPKHLRLRKSKMLLWRKAVQKRNSNLIENSKEKFKQKVINHANQNLYVKKSASKSLGIKKLEQKLTSLLLKYTNTAKVSLSLKNIQNEILFKVMTYAPYKTAAKKLRSYSRSVFYYEAIELFILLSEKGGNAKLLAMFIALKFRFMRRHNTFLTFLKRTLFVFNQIEASRWQGIKIKISGRFNNAPRAKGRIIQCGRLPLQSTNSKIDYYKTHIYTPVGAFGLKVWVCEKE
jgi:ribosomal protein S3